MISHYSNYYFKIARGTYNVSVKMILHARKRITEIRCPGFEVHDESTTANRYTRHVVRNVRCKYSAEITCNLRNMTLKDLHCIDSVRRVYPHIFDECIGPLYIGERAVFLTTRECQKNESEGHVDIAHHDNIIIVFLIVIYELDHSRRCNLCSAPPLTYRNCTCTS